MKELLKTYIELAKVRITIAVALTTVAGYVLSYGGFSRDMVFPVVGLFFVACGSAALNQFQERKEDANMGRTHKRPLPSGRISSAGALIFIIIISLSGLIMIWLSSNLISMLLALSAMVWYNGIYTFLKKVTAFAVVPGSFIGALPPAVGWTAAGGNITDPRIIILAFFYFIWQIPHFWLLMMKYSNQYEEAGFPSLTQVFSFTQLKRLTFIWTVAAALSSLFIPLFNVSTSIYIKLLMPLLAIGLIIVFSGLLNNNKEFKFGRYFMSINIFMLLITISLYFDP